MRLAARRLEDRGASPADPTPMFEVVFVCPDCRACVERKITPVRQVETFPCVGGCAHVFQEPANIWAIALAMLGPAPKPAT